jgi:hypothetical protein
MIRDHWSILNFSIVVKFLFIKNGVFVVKFWLIKNGVKDGFSFFFKVAAPVHDAMRSLSPVFLGLPTLPTLPEPSAAANDPKKKAGVTPAAVLSDSSSSSDSSSDDRLV